MCNLTLNVCTHCVESRARWTLVISRVGWRMPNGFHWNGLVSEDVWCQRKTTSLKVPMLCGACKIKLYVLLGVKYIGLKWKSDTLNWTTLNFKERNNCPTWLIVWERLLRTWYWNYNVISKWMYKISEISYCNCKADALKNWNSIVFIHVYFFSTF